MATTNTETGTRIDEIDDRVFRIHTPIREMPQLHLSRSKQHSKRDPRVCRVYALDDSIDYAHALPISQATA